jgi:hypothetical protein
VPQFLSTGAASASVLLFKYTVPNSIQQATSCAGVVELRVSLSASKSYLLTTASKSYLLKYGYFYSISKGYKAKKECSLSAKA